LNAYDNMGRAVGGTPKGRTVPATEEVLTWGSKKLGKGNPPSKLRQKGLAAGLGLRTR